MDDKRLQKLKEYWSVERYTIELSYLEISNTILELITEVERLRGEEDSLNERLRTQKLAFEHLVADLRKQLQEAQGLAKTWKDAYVDVEKAYNKKCKELDVTKTLVPPSVRNLHAEIADLRKQLEQAQAELTKEPSIDGT